MSRVRNGQPSLYAFFRKAPGEIGRDLVRLVLVEPVLGHEPRQEGAVAAACHVVPRGIER